MNTGIDMEAIIKYINDYMNARWETGDCECSIWHKQ